MLWQTRHIFSRFWLVAKNKRKNIHIHTHAHMRTEKTKGRFKRFATCAGFVVFFFISSICVLEILFVSFVVLLYKFPIKMFLIRIANNRFYNTCKKQKKRFWNWISIESIKSVTAEYGKQQQIKKGKTWLFLIGNWTILCCFIAWYVKVQMDWNQWQHLHL